MPPLESKGEYVVREVCNMDGELMEILERYKGKSGAIIPVLQEIQNHYGYISPEAVSTIARELKLSENEIYGVATFYAQFKFSPPGKHKIKVCLGTACHVRGGEILLETVERELGIKTGETTRDGLFSLERVACMGCCAVAPVVAIDGTIHGKMNQVTLISILEKLKKEEM